ncbi:DUF983 domain-containing protein [Martelella alba]|uniref:DUF983 domain-containing protein n=1 Tax=Martelella alba TaxID=2590451 RepID=A0A506UGW5_9HYPH|nr:DUF983 domain-containing protein [Martelella alba]TPW31497.1 DUF983 domain-containing protein [Martelella alba]
MAEHGTGKLSPFSTGLAGRCPKCGRAGMFSGFLTLKPRCEACGLDYGFADSADGPAVFVILIVGFIVIGLVLWAEVTYQPPLWLHAVIFLPLAVLLSLGGLRLAKGLLIALQFHHRAGESWRDDGR